MRQREATWLVVSLVVALLGARLAWTRQQHDLTMLEARQGEGASGWRPLDAIGVLRNP